MRERLCRGEPDSSSSKRVAPGHDSLEVQRGTFHHSALTQDCLTGRGRREALGRSVQQLNAQAPLEQGNPPSCGDMTDAEHTRGAGETARTRHGKKKADIVPLPPCRHPVHL
jgi:hypothetical protein